ncbi:hypothetical protein E2C01_042353 [Portunus trituberculatus]|uniref:Uncharacterized protein n=1 Tax=Portunus trituberculatus TaxID=210409 RepID=A0A5B7FSU9_PORTR|nr:hypothetical protein [Portunus trituberculatus]
MINHHAILLGNPYFLCYLSSVSIPALHNSLGTHRELPSFTPPQGTSTASFPDTPRPSTKPPAHQRPDGDMTLHSDSEFRRLEEGREGKQESWSSRLKKWREKYGQKLEEAVCSERTLFEGNRKRFLQAEKNKTIGKERGSQTAKNHKRKGVGGKYLHKG